ncbi:MAG: cupin domain-containing protein [Bacillota bacterium]
MLKLYEFSFSNEKLIEKIVDDENLMLNHVILQGGEALPEHYSNSNVYLIIVKGSITIRLESNPAEKFITGSILSIPYNVKMNIGNMENGPLEFFIVKSPNPRDMVNK